MTFKLQEIPLANAEETRQLGINLGRNLTAGTVILLSGDLGAGKTTLVQGIGAGLGISEPIVSPTFTLINEYSEGRLPLYHFDLYRLSSPEVEALGLENYWEGGEFALGIMAIEWAEKLTYMPSSYLQIQLIYTPNDRRLAKLLAMGDFTLNLS
ncbi:tRNA (adenosine(37)-N6)-threonylcarbamoyltransferase complex ATPase subunit type 1 TsaE [Floridanema evergladense]|uniref:tRNA threonylcarbamoyladenosine biosynthesis protein TsaE n=1 Tax=Floridaenema evergladense BLCC-F167 TaxID=3153639 RepID=A0ABV4WX33_9CYAN